MVSFWTPHVSRSLMTSYYLLDQRQVIDIIFLCGEYLEHRRLSFNFVLAKGFLGLWGYETIPRLIFLWDTTSLELAEAFFGFETGAIQYQLKNIRKLQWATCSVWPR